MTNSDLPDWLLPPPEGFHAEDLDHLPRLPPHTELVDGSLALLGPQEDFHTLMLYLLENGFRRTVPADLRVRREMSVVLGPRQRPEPDIMVIHAEALRGPDNTAYHAGDVVLAIEVVSPESEERDRKRKPTLYAEAGIPHFWLVETIESFPTVNVYELDPATHSYVMSGTYQHRVDLTVPFDIDIDIDIDLTKIDDL
ncbi:Uma2 family endonuclease [Sphaerisporangium perillae]|uniref:Uma2 family endonuclease n=1 Tax=Sphaerisporangium perillae TaxID=2935860 RepID=UPI0020102536|nr:Uma2 family endonuclease [Sphaerisporangium perillae]